MLAAGENHHVRPGKTEQIIREESRKFTKLLDFLFIGLIGGWAALAAEKTVPQRPERVT